MQGSLKYATSGIFTIQYSKQRISTTFSYAVDKKSFWNIQWRIVLQEWLEKFLWTFGFCCDSVKSYVFCEGVISKLFKTTFQASSICDTEKIQQFLWWSSYFTL